MNEEKVTVVVAVYNIEQYISKCIESIITQTYENLQIILVDDGSTDSSGKTCDEFALRDKRIEVVHQPNGGLSQARNTGISHAEGSWIAFIDGDDYIHPQFIEVLCEAANKSGSKIVICDYRKVKDCETVSNEHVGEYQYTVLSSEQMLQNWHGKLTKIETVAWNKLYAIELFKNGIQYPVGKLHEDIYTTHQLVAKADQIIIVWSELYFYLQRSNSIVGQRLTDNRIYQSIEAQEERIAFFAKKEYRKAYGNLRKGILKHLIYYYCKSYIGVNYNVGNKKQLNKYLQSKIGKYIKSM